MAVLTATQTFGVVCHNHLKLQKVKIPIEFHVYPVGGHGYGLRPSVNPVSHWNLRLAEWLTAQGWLKPKG